MVYLYLRLSTWLETLDLDATVDTKNLYVCGRHFADYMYSDKSKLYSYAVPNKNYDRVTDQSTPAECIELSRKCCLPRSAPLDQPASVCIEPQVSTTDHNQISSPSVHSSVSQSTSLDTPAFVGPQPTIPAHPNTLRASNQYAHSSFSDSVQASASIIHHAPAFVIPQSSSGYTNRQSHTSSFSNSVPRSISPRTIVGPHATPVNLDSLRTNNHCTSSAFASQPVQPTPQLSTNNTQMGPFSAQPNRSSADMATQTIPSDNVDDLITKRNEQAKEIKRLRIALKRAQLRIEQLMTHAESNITVKQFETACGTYLKPEIAELVKAQLSDANYSKEMKEFCLRLFVKSGRFYEDLRKYFRLPTRQTLMKEISKISSESGLNKDILRAMKTNAEAQTDPKKKICTIAIDEMALKKHLQLDTKQDRIVGYTDFDDEVEASHSLTLMAQGVFEVWKQPIAYYFVASTCKTDKTATIIREAVAALIEAGYIPLAVISDQGSNVFGACNQLIRSKEEPFFIVLGHKVFYVYDPPHLFKNTRNCLLNNIIHIGDDVAVWKHITDFYELDKLNEPYRDAPKLTAKHMNPVNREKMRVRFATETLSATVAKHMHRYANSGDLDEGAKITADFILKFDTLFDLFNATEEADPAKPFRRSFCNSPLQMEFLNMMAAYIDAITVTGKNDTETTNRFKFLRGWLQNIAAIQQMVAYLQNSFGDICLPTKNLNQDCLENFFGLMRSGGGDNRNPTCYEFKNRFRRACCVDILNTSNDTNCENDLNYLLLSELYRPVTFDAGMYRWSNDMKFKNE